MLVSAILFRSKEWPCLARSPPPGDNSVSPLLCFLDQVNSTCTLLLSQLLKFLFYYFCVNHCFSGWQQVWLAQERCQHCRSKRLSKELQHSIPRDVSQNKTGCRRCLLYPCSRNQKRCKWHHVTHCNISNKTNIFNCLSGGGSLVQMLWSLLSTELPSLHFKLGGWCGHALSPCLKKLCAFRPNGTMLIFFRGGGWGHMIVILQAPYAKVQAFFLGGGV